MPIVFANKFAESLSGGFRRSLRDAARTRTRSKRSYAEGFTLRYPFPEGVAAGIKALQDRVMALPEQNVQ